MLSVIKLNIQNTVIAISGDDCNEEVKAAARVLAAQFHASEADIKRIDYPGRQAFEPYNGWPNYETWLADQWAGADQETDRKTKQIVKRARGRAGAADQLQQLFEEENPLQDQANFYTDLLTHGMGRIDWHHLAEHIANEIEKEW